jgi:hypothetical protein
MSTIFHHPCGHHRACKTSGDAETEALCCMVRSNSAHFSEEPTKAPVEFP